MCSIYGSICILSFDEIELYVAIFVYRLTDSHIIIVFGVRRYGDKVGRHRIYLTLETVDIDLRHSFIISYSR